MGGTKPDHPPRVRDLPMPRKVKGAIAPAARVVFAWPYRVALSGLYRIGLKPWQLTMASLANNFVVGWLLLTDRRLLPGLLLLPAGLLDIFDGGLARLRGEDSRLGAFMDSVLDRVSDGVVFGCLFWSLSGQHLDVQAELCLAALAISLLVSHVRAEAESLGLSLSGGLVQRLERYVALMIGLTLPGALLPVLAALTGLGGLTVLQRVWSAWRRLASPAAPAGSEDRSTSSDPPP